MKQIKNTIRIYPDRPPNRRRIGMITNRILQSRALRWLHILIPHITHSSSILDIATRHGGLGRLARIFFADSRLFSRTIESGRFHTIVDFCRSPTRPFGSRYGGRGLSLLLLLLLLLLTGRWDGGPGGLVAAIFARRIARRGL